ncbi:DUF6069 family protein [Galbitalea sp. SE-J8]|uniref:DUF6069 family protein n=1 Tax=Galbitalea sp. SE-J8 TaxID=3054952 RepID=UPI00259D242C|nr:DUF6069 family protein [Galbitalea sp. SE-J8]MDM4764056.1 DUF6069 family protein [Galbitalea sp. SE-J8]
MATTTASVHAPGRARTLALLGAAFVVAGIACSIDALAAVAAGATAFAPLTPAVYLPFVAVGVVVGFVGWRLVVRRSARSRTVLRALVPAVVLASLVPDIVLIATGFIPGTTAVGGVALMLMHVIVAAVAVPVYSRILPTR